VSHFAHDIADREIAHATDLREEVVLDLEVEATNEHQLVATLSVPSGSATPALTSANASIAPKRDRCAAGER